MTVTACPNGHTVEIVTDPDAVLAADGTHIDVTAAECAECGWTLHQPVTANE